MLQKYPLSARTRLAATAPLLVAIGALGTVFWRVGDGQTQATAATYRVVGTPASLDAATRTDGDSVTWQQNEDAIRSYAECLASAGYSLSILPGAGLRPTRVSITVISASRISEAQVDRERCQTGVSEISTAYNLRFSEPSLNDIRQVREVMRTCLDHVGTLPVPSVEYSGIFADYGSELGGNFPIEKGQERAYQRCSLEVEAATGFLAPLPIVQ